MLLNKHPLVLDKSLAKIIGLNEALVLGQVHYWIELNKKNKRNYHEERYWTYNTITEWQEEFPFWSINTVKRTFKKLREMGLIIVDNFNAYQMDRTLWYTIDYEKLNQLTIEEYNFDESIESNCPNNYIQNEQMEEFIMDQAIPEISSEIPSEIYNQSINRREQCTIEKEDEIERKTKYKDNFRENCERILGNCELYAIDKTYRDAVAHVITLLLLDAESSNRIRIGNNLIPPQIVKKDIAKLNFFIIEHAVNKFKKASERFEIKNTIAYLKACIFNAINEYQIDIDSQLRMTGVI